MVDNVLATVCSIPVHIIIAVVIICVIVIILVMVVVSFVQHTVTIFILDAK